MRPGKLRTVFLKTAVCAALVSALGCASTPRTHFYTLHVALRNGPASSSNGPVLVVEPFSAEPLAADTRLVYRTSPYTVDFYTYHQWAVDPAEQVTHALVEVLRGSGRFSAVYVAPAATAGDLRLRGRVIELCEIDEGNQWYGQVTLDLTLLRNGAGEIVWHKRFSQRIPAASRNPEAVVKALSEGVKKIAEEISQSK